MSKTSIISNYINKCEQVLEKRDENAAEELEEEIVSVYCAEIKDITVGLDNYVGYSHNVNFLKDIKILKAKLENYRSDIKRARIDKNNETNTTFNINNSSTTNINNKINITLEQTIKNITDISSDILSDDDKQKLEDKLASLQVSVNLKDKEKSGKKLLNVIKFAIEKGPETFIAISNFINFITNEIAPMFK